MSIKGYILTALKAEKLLFFFFYFTLLYFSDKNNSIYRFN